MAGLEHPEAAGRSRRRTNLTAQTAFGLSWAYLSTASPVVAKLAYTATISRLLGPVAFVLLAMVNKASSTADIAIGLICMADLLGAVGRLRWRLAPLVLGPAALTAAEGNP
jgi:hypothetical protein